MLIKEFKNTSDKVYLTISIDEEIGFVTDVWNGPFGTQENFRNGVLSVVEVLKEKKYNKWLADLRNMEGSWDSSRVWMVEELLPLALKAGLRWEAVVIPKEVFSKLSTKDTLMRLRGYELRQFEDYSKAKEWLRGAK